MMKSSIRLRGSLFTLTVVQLFSTNEAEILQDFTDAINKSANFFKNAPIILDLNELSDNKLDLAALCKNLRSLGLIIVGIRTNNAFYQQQTIQNQLALMAGHTETDKPETKKISEKQQKQTVGSSSPAKIITQPIRSGQQIYAKGDLIISSTVSAGAEVLADGHIHIYGTLRGRALAGVLGDTNARIFCKSLEAELVSIAGHYLVYDNLANSKSSGEKQIFLENGQLQVISL